MWSRQRPHKEWGIWGQFSGNVGVSKLFDNCNLVSAKAIYCLRLLELGRFAQKLPASVVSELKKSIEYVVMSTAAWFSGAKLQRLG